MDDRTNFTNSTYTSYTLQNGVASCAAGSATSCPGVSIAETLNPFQVHEDVRYDAFYAQDQYTLGRVTVQGAVRFDHAWSYFPDQSVGGVRFFPGNTTFAQNDPAFATPSTNLCSTDLMGGGLPAGFDSTCINNITGYKDITVRGGLAWDVRGDGKTSVKLSMGKFLDAASNGNDNYTAGNPLLGRMPTSASRSWNDANKNYTPDCVLESPLANGECGQLNNLAFGTPKFTNSFDSNLMGGWGVRPSDWGFVASVQQQLVARTSVEFSYTRRWLQNFTATDNILQPVSAYTPFSVVAPTDSRLGSASGQTITGLYNVTQNVASTVNQFATLADSFGTQYQRYNGFLLNLTSRLKDGLTVQGGFNTGKTVADNCAVRAADPSLNLVAGSPAATLGSTGQGPNVGPSNPWCHVDTGFVTRVTGLATYVIPHVDVLVSSTFR
ncbi:MAG: hypothetical protein ACRDT5_21070, partial [Mycobacterium sp.]